MQVLEIKRYPDKVLRKKCEKIEEVSSYEKDLFSKMLFTMRHFQGIGLAAPQVGILKRLIVVDIGEKEFKEALRKSHFILYLADNAGEVVFDKVLIEEIKSLYPDKEIIYAVREKPIINDALISDAYFCGIDKVAQVISSGCDAPGTVLSLCSQDFLKVYKKADMIISKGQGNFEALWGKRDRIFFLFMAKCPVVAKEVGSRVGEKILLF